MSDLICPRCGRGSDEAPFIDAFCTDCYSINVKCPTKVEIEQCKGCEKVRIKGEWIPFSRKAISDYVAGRCKGGYDEGHYILEEQIAEFAVSKEGKRAVVRRSIDLEIKTVMCRDCSRVSGGYFQGIIQLRGDEKRVDRYAEMLIKRLEKITFIGKAEEKHGGLDIYVGNSKAVLGLLTELKAKAHITRKLAGVEEGKRFYRTTFLIRL